MRFTKLLERNRPSRKWHKSPDRRHPVFYVKPCEIRQCKRYVKKRKAQKAERLRRRGTEPP